MKHRTHKVAGTLMAGALVVSHFGYTPEAAWAKDSAARQKAHLARHPAGNHLRGNGIAVSEPRVYDDARLRQMLEAAEARLASLGLLDREAISRRIGADSATRRGQPGASEGAGGVVTPPATQDAQKTLPPTNSTGETVRAPASNLPPAFSVSASDILNEQLQLRSQVEDLRLMLAGAPTPKATLGFSISLAPNRRYKDAAAVVEVEMWREWRGSVEEGLAITALTPREKTYNVAAIVDKWTPGKGGLPAQIIAPLPPGRKNYYLVQDQDASALALPPTSGGKVRLRWQYKPVLGRRYVTSGLRQTLVQLAFPASARARDGEVVRVTVRTYWRRLRRRSGAGKQIIPGTHREAYKDLVVRLRVDAPASDAPKKSDPPKAGGRVQLRADH